MRVNISCCLLTFVLGCNVTAEIIHEVVEEKDPASLPCPHSVGAKVTWSRETNGRKVDILTADCDRDIRHMNDPLKRYNSQVDKSLHIRRVNLSDTGRYFCDNETVELTVIPSGTVRHNAAEGTSVTLTCPPDVGGSDVPTWSRDIGPRQGKRSHVSPVDKTLTVKGVRPGDSGLYYCDGKPAAYLNVSRATSPPTTSPPPPPPTTTTTSTTSTTTTTTTTSPPPPPTTTTTTSTTSTTTTTPTTTSTTANTVVSKEDQKPSPGLVVGIVVPFLLLLLLLLIIIIYFIWRCRFKRRGGEEVYHVYNDIQDGFLFQPSNDVGGSAGPTGTYCVADFPAGSNHDDPTYCTIPDLPPVEKKTDTFPPNESPYSSINNTSPGGNDKGSTQLSDNTYFLLQKPKTPGNNSDQYL